MIKKLFPYLKSMRAGEIAYLSGIALMGLVFSRQADYARISAVFRVLAAVYLLYGHIAVFNELCGLDHDRIDENKKNMPLVSGRLSVKGLRLFSLSLLAVSGCMFLSVSRGHFFLFLIYVLISFLYSHPKVHLKGRPVIPTVLHFLAGTAGFMFGYMKPGGDKGPAGLLVGMFFGLLLASGHLNHETADYEYDRMNGLNTSAAYYGKKAASLAGFMLLSAASTYFVLLAVLGMVPWYLGPVIIPVYIVCALAYGKAYRGGLEPAGINAYRNTCRIAFLAAGVLMTVLLLPKAG
ncbi:MAG: UbiA prenyltransferase family protein [Elusimicrobia bacterium]|nr:UbiA prenyltransferase family protein [Elusimicrobiota bacterium]